MGAVVDDAGLTLLEGDCRELLPTLPEASVQCVVTSPPYWGLRDYGCEGQLGLEPTPEAYLAAMVAVFRAVRRVLRDDGTLWMNMGDSYATGTTADREPTTLNGSEVPASWAARSQPVRCGTPNGLKTKDLVGMPWRLAFALQADGWYLRADIIWAKPNPMPESVTDRPTKAHEYVFLLTKSARYFYDADAVREPHAEPWRGNGEHESSTPHAGRLDDPRKEQAAFTVARRQYNPAGRNLRSVWTLATEPTPEAHFATFPSALASRCIQAGTSEKGCCAACGAPWARQTSTDRRATPVIPSTAKGIARMNGSAPYRPNHRETGGGGAACAVQTIGWTPPCACAAPPTPCTVLDPFAGSGTTGQVAQTLGRRAVLIELSAPYVALARTRTAQRGLFAAPAAR